MSTVMFKIVKPQSDAEKVTRTVTDTIEVTVAVARSWKLPPFQRPLRVNTKVIDVSQEIRKTQVIPGTIILGVLGADRYLIDGQHRREAFYLSEVEYAYVDIRIAHFKSLAEMADEFYKVNSRIASMRPDDYLRALESSTSTLAKIRAECSFVGYDMIRRSDKAPILSMSAVLRGWWASGKEVPSSSGGSAIEIVKQLSDEEADHCISFLKIAKEAWGKDAEYVRLWGSLNLVMCMWLYRRIVIGAYSTKTERITKDMFRKCLMSLSADATYLDWLVGRQLSDVNRSPAYDKVKSLVAARILAETEKKPFLPSPAWAHNSGRKKKV